MQGKLERTVVVLEAEDIGRLKQIIVDEDQGEALSFLIYVIDQKVQCAQAETHKPTFEGGTGESPAHTWHEAQH